MSVWSITRCRKSCRRSVAATRRRTNRREVLALATPGSAGPEPLALYPYPAFADRVCGAAADSLLRPDQPRLSADLRLLLGDSPADDPAGTGGILARSAP